MNNQKITLMLLVGTVLLLACASQNNADSQSGTADTIETDTVAIPDSVYKKPQVVMFGDTKIRATGNEPFWLLELNKDSVHFKLMDGFEFTELLPMPAINTNDSLQYQFQTGPAEVTVLILNKPCVDGMSGFKSPFTVNIKFTGPDNTQRYNGCGDYLSAYNKIREPEIP